MKTKFVLKNNKLNFIFILILTIVVLFSSLKDNFLDVVNQIKELNLFWLFISIILVIGYWFFSSLSMYLISKKIKPNISFKNIFKLNIITHFFNGVTPFASGGQPYQVYALKKEKISFVNSTNISIETFVTYQIALIILGSIAIISNKVFDIFPNVAFLKFLVLIGFIVNLFVGLGLFTISFAQKFNRNILKIFVNLGYKLNLIKNKNEIMEKFEKYIIRFYDGTKNLLKDKKNLICVVLLQLAGLITYYLIPLAILYGMGDYSSFNFFVSIIATSYVMIIGSFVPLPGGTGGLEYSFLAFFGNFISGGKLTTLMIVWRFCTYYFGMIIGAVMLNVKRRKKQ